MVPLQRDPSEAPQTFKPNDFCREQRIRREVNIPKWPWKQLMKLHTQAQHCDLSLSLQLWCCFNAGLNTLKHLMPSSSHNEVQAFQFLQSHSAELHHPDIGQNSQDCHKATIITVITTKTVIPPQKQTKSHKNPHCS